MDPEFGKLLFDEAFIKYDAMERTDYKMSIRISKKRMAAEVICSDYYDRNKVHIKSRNREDSIILGQRFSTNQIEAVCKRYNEAWQGRQHAGAGKIIHVEFRGLFRHLDPSILAVSSAYSMLRTQLVRSVARTTRHTKPHASRLFGTTPLQRAEVELTIGG